MIIDPFKFAAPGGGFDPTDYGTPFFWLPGSAYNGTTGDWTDQSSNAYVFSQANSSIRPNLISADLNGKDVVEFASLDNVVNASTINLKDGSTVFVVVNDDTSGAAYISKEPNDIAFGSYSGSYYLAKSFAAFIATGGTLNSNWRVMAYRWQDLSGTWTGRIYEDGTLGGTGTLGNTLSNNTNLVIGAENSGNFFVGKIAAILAYGAMNDTDFANAGAALATEYGL